MRTFSAQSMSMLLACAALFAAACGRTINLGEIGDGGAAALLWSATFEPGDLSEWTADGAGGTVMVNVATATAATAEKAHGGRFSGKVTVSPTADMASIDYLFRHAPSPTEGYYSAWYYIPSPFTLGSWLSIIHFVESSTGDGRNVLPTWDVNIQHQLDGSMAAQIYDFVHKKNMPQPAPLPVPLDKWVHFEFLLRKAVDSTGRVALWQDGVLILDFPNIPTVQNSWVEWNIGASSNSTTPVPTFIYVDDAAISLYRLGTASR